MGFDSTAEVSLREQIEAHAAFFDDILGLVPADHLNANGSDEVKLSKYAKYTTTQLEKPASKKRKAPEDKPSSNAAQLKARQGKKLSLNELHSKLKEAIDSKKAQRHDKVKEDVELIKEDIQFGQFNFAKPKVAQIDTPKVRKEKKLKKLLEKAEKFDQKIQSTEDADQRQELINRKLLKTALARAEGVKVKDDPKLIKKTLKRKEAQKRKSAREWNERKNEIDDQKKQRIETREEHLKDKTIRHTKKSEKKKPNDKRGEELDDKQSGKKPRRAGFEGKRNKFLNSK